MASSSYNLCEQLFQRIDSVTATFVTDISQKAIVAITPVVTVGLTLSFIGYGLLVMRGAVEMPVTEFIGRSLRIAVVIAIAAAGGLYQTEIAGLINTVTDDLARALVSDPAASGNAGRVIDLAAGSGFTKAGEAWDKGSFFSSDGWAFYFLAGVIFVTTGLLCAIGGAFIILAKIALAILAGLGPIFIVAMLFQPTLRFFELWLAQVVNYGLLIVLFAIAFGLIMSIYGDYIDNIRFDGTQNIWWVCGGALILSVASAVIVLQIPQIAGGLAGGVGLGYYFELRSLKNLTGSFGGRGRPGRGALGLAGGAWRTGGTAARAAYHTPGAARAGAQWAAINPRQGARAAMGYFRNHMGGARRP